MNTKEIIKTLVNNSPNVGSIAELERKLDISNGTINKWDKSQPTLIPLNKVADYFNVSVDYLLNRKSNDNEFIDVKDLFKKANSFNGKPISDHDKLVAKQLLDAYFENKKDE
ncbi:MULTISPECIES: helix-turn-helix transcriptional regulator [unclassified Enterococcus]|uniref:helix-turn-helix domain-containing protein n=1 Tax=unclassified Enterococcus TaxID=2608891 RepID=UPI0015559CBC|nr:MULTISPECIES: helix-turn-helix transcriptional regulator [unclassified Enterococcus]MBS7578327.1 helix-turn-helix transcriptional regulator [Enterococcus sp. MMGLQ5-2]MBS7585564.1 helix-turn-helix transcriptional regulator [Enterococcus sp. MMGLQ5-1]NPD13423.1 helix-turn-helix transcriptional regulator [Enterococcus sp. MMGLQ5-1]NPD38158.1 helix-turn-helix transcriptional regulator [Enterococcus sp. MMGLQ5-2]